MSLTKVSFSMINGAVYNVLDYGAKGDGVTDDRNAINNAIAAVVAAGKGTIFFPNGTYYISNFIGNTGSSTNNIYIALIGEVGTVINSNPTSYSDFALYLNWTNLKEIEVKNLTIQCNTKTAVGIQISTASFAESAIVDNCVVTDCYAPSTGTQNAYGIQVYSQGFSYTANVTNCRVTNVTRDKVSLVCQGIGIVGFEVSNISNNIVTNVLHNSTASAGDADGILVFSYTSGTDYKKSSTSVVNNYINECEGRFIKLQTEGSALVQGNVMSNQGALTLSNNFRGVDSQVADANIINNKMYFSTNPIVGTSCCFAELQSPVSSQQTVEEFELFTQVFSNNSIFTGVLFPYGIIAVPPDASLTITQNIQICENVIQPKQAINYSGGSSFGASTFIYATGFVDPASFTSQCVWTVAQNQVFAYNFITFNGTQYNYTDKLYMYVYDNFKPQIGNTREIFYSGASAGVYTSTSMIRDNMVGESTGTMTWPINFALVFEGTDFYSGGQTMTSVPIAYTFSRCYKKGGMWGVQRSNQFYISGDASAWTALV